MCDMLGCLYCCRSGFDFLCISIVAHGFHLQSQSGEMHYCTQIYFPLSFSNHKMSISGAEL